MKKFLIIGIITLFGVNISINAQTLFTNSQDYGELNKHRQEQQNKKKDEKYGKVISTEKTSETKTETCVGVGNNKTCIKTERTTNRTTGITTEKKCITGSVGGSAKIVSGKVEGSQCVTETRKK
ncbi:MAG: hypothetical protein LBR28_02865 [Bacteroidales bacterium]|jgi:hypothetical protein|nr:hypothetical protein [Bacteroidales bacterium]